jgi:hypothetical protein
MDHEKRRAFLLTNLGHLDGNKEGNIKLDLKETQSGNVD